MLCTVYGGSLNRNENGRTAARRSSLKNGVSMAFTWMATRGGSGSGRAWRVYLSSNAYRIERSNGKQLVSLTTSWDATRARSAYAKEVGECRARAGLRSGGDAVFEGVDDDVRGSFERFLEHAFGGGGDCAIRVRKCSVNSV